MARAAGVDATVFFESVESGDVEMARQCVNAAQYDGMDCDERGAVMDGLYLAVAHSWVDIVRYFLHEVGLSADGKVRDKDDPGREVHEDDLKGITPMHVAANIYPNTPESISVIELLIEMGADLSVGTAPISQKGNPQAAGWRAIDVARSRENTDACALLEQAGAAYNKSSFCVSLENFMADGAGSHDMYNVYKVTRSIDKSQSEKMLNALSAQELADLSAKLREDITPRSVRENAAPAEAVSTEDEAAPIVSGRDGKTFCTSTTTTY